jgi:type IV secretory pathway TrbL component
MATKIDALADVMPLDAEAFRTKRTGAGRSKTVLDPALLARIAEIVTKNNGMQGAKLFTSTAVETAAYNDNRNTAAKTAGKETPAAITNEANAERLARKDASRFSQYVNEIAATMEPSRAVSLRVVNENRDADTHNDNPQMRWAFVLVNHRERKAKETPATPAETPATPAAS